MTEQGFRSCQGIAHRAPSGTLIGSLSALPHRSSSYASSFTSSVWIGISTLSDTRQRSWYVPIACTRCVPKLQEIAGLLGRFRSVILASSTKAWLFWLLSCGSNNYPSYLFFPAVFLRRARVPSGNVGAEGTSGRSVGISPSLHSPVRLLLVLLLVSS